jgi:K(+)-stimulated pyrophosphate-energized sodium pump
MQQQKTPILLKICNKLLFFTLCSISTIICYLIYINKDNIFYIQYYSSHTLIIFITIVLFFIFMNLFLGTEYLKNIFNINTKNTELMEEKIETKANNMSNLIFSAAFTYLMQQYKYILYIGIGVLSFLYYHNFHIALGFLIGVVFSCMASFFSMYVCVSTNIRTAIQANRSLKEAFDTALQGSLSGSFFTNAICLLCPLLIFNISTFISWQNGIFQLIDICFGASFGCSFICIFGRIAGGIFTKAADVGADLVGKVESKLEEDDARNPAVIADNVGDNVGDCNGMIADVFESYVVTLLMAILWKPDVGRFAAYKYLYIYLVTSYFALCLFGLINTYLCKHIMSLNNNMWNKLETYFYSHVFLTTSMSIVWFLITYKFFGLSTMLIYKMIYCVLIGAAVSIGILKSTEYYTSDKYSPVQNLAHASASGHGTNIIYGLSISFLCVGFPLTIIILGVIISYMLLGFIGIILCAILIISLTGAIITLDLIGPITDNAGGIAEVSQMDGEVRDITDYLDSLGNITKAITKGFSIGSAVFTALISNMVFVNEVAFFKNVDIVCSITQPIIFCGILIGGIITYLFCGLGLRAVGEAAQAIVLNIRKQLKDKPGILTGEEAPDYNETIIYLTKVAIQKMILPALLPIIIPISCFFLYRYFFGYYLIYDFLASVSLGATFTAILLSINMTTAGGAWDNSKKYIEGGECGGKKSFAHMCAVTGDTVGDPYKDTVGPSLNALAKLIPIVSYLIVRFF